MSKDINLGFRMSELFPGEGFWYCNEGGKRDAVQDSGIFFRRVYKDEKRVDHPPILPTPSRRKGLSPQATAARETEEAGALSAPRAGERSCRSSHHSRCRNSAYPISVKNHVPPNRLQCLLLIGFLSLPPTSSWQRPGPSLHPLRRHGPASWRYHHGQCSKRA